MNARSLLLPLCLLASTLAGAMWIGGGGAAWLAVAAILAVLGLLGMTRGAAGPSGLPGALVPVLLLGAVILGFAATGDLSRFSQGWDERVESWEEDIQRRLANELDGLLTRAEAASNAGALRWRQGEQGALLSPDVLRDGIQAVMIFDVQGQLRSWVGTHQGPVPAAARFGEARYLYREGAIFGYLYVSQTLPGGDGSAVAAALLRADLPPGLDEDLQDFTSRFERAHGAEIVVSRADRVEGPGVWDLRWDDEVLFSVNLEPLSEADALESRARWWERGMTLGLATAWLLLLMGGAPGGASRLVAGLGVFPLLMLLPLGRLLGAPQLFSPGGVLLPVPVELTLGHILVLALAGVFLVGAVMPTRAARLPPWVSVGLTIMALLAFLWAMASGASAALLAEGELGWVTFVWVASLAAGLLFNLTFHLSGRDRSREVEPVRLVLALVTGLTLVGVGAALVRVGPGIPLWAILLFAIPLFFLITGLPRRVDRGGRLLVLLATLALGAGAVLPWGWSLRVEGRMALAEEQMERLGTPPDPFLEFLLLRAGEEARAMVGTGRNPVEALYGIWTRSGLAREDVPVWLTVWTPDGRAQEELRIGVEGERPPIPMDLVQDAVVGGDLRLRRYDLPNMHYVAVIHLSRGAFISMVVPPRRTLATPSPLGPLFSPARGERDPLVLIPFLPGEPASGVQEVRWIRTAEGWQGELDLFYPDEVVHAHYRVPLPGPLLVTARGTLLLLLVLGTGALVWVLGHRSGSSERWMSAPVATWFGSFRGRVTLTLFAFFLIPTLGFGALAWQTLSAAAGRTAETLAERAAEEAAGWFGEVGGAMDVLARRAGSDLLLYERGELVRGSVPELVDLGLYQGWLPADIHGRMVGGEELVTSTRATLGGVEYVVAFRRIEGGQVLGAPAPLQAGATALRQRDVADLIAFAGVAGAGLSILLSLLVGRALTRPIQTLQVASERVGAGNMGVHLPEDRQDEFGAVFGAFNRMVDRLGSTRRALMRSSRRTRAIMEEVATGVLALDPQGRVILANPRAEELLGVSLERGEPLPRSPQPEDLRTALALWVQAYIRDDLPASTTEFQAGDRRIRARARRVSRRGPPGGTVLSLEDVTDELRTERILAWGEMARQVAHEVKNPLTPIKLGVQHVRRAWLDGRPDFDEILERNVEAILTEIDRLAGIAAGFSRFGAPEEATSQPLQPVDAAAVVEEVMGLYRAGEGPVSVELEPPSALPPVRARPGELKEVLVNLLENARAALPSGGVVRVSLIPSREVAGGVEIEVRDNGVGIPPDLLPRIFEPHFSTRSAGGGLGLAIVRRLVESWGGTVRAESLEGSGTAMIICVPPWEGPPLPDGKGDDGAPPWA
ncbi:MAG: HAMP domain-containing protein [Gemmatimonadales bacterium]|nr:MAG: HAMP domain-containing protein [Gemmatimonadales bacterium]